MGLFGLTGMLNDLSILRLRPFFFDVSTDIFPNILPSYHGSGEMFKYSYFFGRWGLSEVQVFVADNK